MNYLNQYKMTNKNDIRILLSNKLPDAFNEKQKREIVNISFSLKNRGNIVTKFSNQQLLFERTSTKESMIIAINLSDEEVKIPYTLKDTYTDLLSGKSYSHTLTMPTKSVFYLKKI